MSDSKTIILNGTRVWFGVLGAILIHGASTIWFASSLNTTVKLGFQNINEKVEVIAKTVEVNRIEAKQDIKELRRETLSKR